LLIEEVLLIEEDEEEVDFQIEKFIVNYAENHGILLINAIIGFIGTFGECLIKVLVSLIMVYSLTIVANQILRRLWLPLVVLMELT